MSSFEIVTTSKFESDLRLAKKRGLNLNKLNDVLDYLKNGKPLPAKYKDHNLKGNYGGTRECHITPDWLLIYETDKKIRVLSLIRTGTHSDLF